MKGKKMFCLTCTGLRQQKCSPHTKLIKLLLKYLDFFFLSLPLSYSWPMFSLSRKHRCSRNTQQAFLPSMPWWLVEDFPWSQRDLPFVPDPALPFCISTESRIHLYFPYIYSWGRERELSYTKWEISLGIWDSVSLWTRTGLTLTV